MNMQYMWVTIIATFLAGEYVKEFFFRVVALTFDKAVQLEYENITSPSKQIGSGNAQFSKYLK